MVRRLLLLLVLMIMGHANREGRRMNVAVGPRQHDVIDADSGAIAMGRDGNADAEFSLLPTTKKRTRM